MTPGHFSQKGPCKGTLILLRAPRHAAPIDFDERARAGKDGEAKWLKATVYTIIAVLVLTLPVWYATHNRLHFKLLLSFFSLQAPLVCCARQPTLMSTVGVLWWPHIYVVTHT